MVASQLKLAQEAYALLATIGAQAAASTELRAEVASILERCLSADAVVHDAQSRALIGSTWVRCGQPQRALPYLEFDWNLAEPEACALAGSALLGLGAIGPALAALQRAAQAEEVQPAVMINLGRALLIAGQAESALPHLEQALKREPGSTIARLSVAETLLALGRVDDALTQIPESPDDESLIIARVQLLAAASRHGDAAALLREARVQHPDSLPLLLLSAEVADVRGRSGESIALLRQALDKEPDNITLWARLALTGRKGASGPHARKAADKALALAHDKDAALRALATNAHAHVLAEEGHTAEAEAAYRDALNLVPGFVPALSGLGQLLLQGGKVEEALQCFQQVRAVAPLQGWSQLIHARELPDDPAVLEELERAAHQPGLEGPVRSGLLYTVAAAYDKQKDFNRAMTLARTANEASKQLLPYDPAAHRARVEREIARFSSAFIESRAGFGHPSRLPVFVLGMPRSGTTLTEQILGSHSQVFGAGELGLVGEQIAQLVGWEQHLGSRLAYPECVAELTPKRARKMATAWLAQLQAFDPTAQHVIDKLPHNFEHIGLIKLLFPNARIVHCRREPRDIAVSNYITDYSAKFGGMGFAYDFGWIGEQLVDHDRLMVHWHAVFPGQILEVVYEELVDDTEALARRMITFLGLEWEPGVLEFQGLERSVKTASVWQVRQPVYKTSKARWKRYAAHLDALEAALQQVPPMPEPAPVGQQAPGLFEEGMAQMKAKHWREAEAYFRQLLAVHPHHAAAHQFLGGALLHQGQAEQAVEAMRRSLQLLPLHPTWWQNLARAEHSNGNAQGAQQAWQRSLQLLHRQAKPARALADGAIQEQ